MAIAFPMVIHPIDNIDTIHFRMSMMLDRLPVRIYMIVHGLFTRRATSVAFCLLVGSSSLVFSQTLPQLPQISDISCGTSSGKTTLVPSGGKLQAALDAASPGDTILLEAGATFIGSFTLPAKSGTNCITIRTAAPDSTLPRADQRITPEYASALPKIITTGKGNSLPALTAADGAHHYKVMGVEITHTSTSGYVYSLIELGHSRMTSLSQMPHHIELDRVYVHGLPSMPVRRCINLHSGAATIINSYIAGCKDTDNDSQAILAGYGSGPYRIINNYLEAAGENILIGGVDPKIRDLVPSDIEIKNTLFSKSLTWKVTDPSYEGIHWSVKNHLELKNARRVLIDHNIFENNWTDAQQGWSILITPRNQYGNAPWSVTEDVIVSNNIIRRTAQGLTMAGMDNAYPSQRTNRILIKNNLWYDIGGDTWRGRGSAKDLFQMVRGPQNVTIEHNTALQMGNILTADGSPTSDYFTFRDNITMHNTYGVHGSGSKIGSGTLATYFTSINFTNNVIINNPYPNMYPSTTLNTPSVETVGFIDPTQNKYQLTSSSQYHRAATDGTDIGVNWDELATAKIKLEPPTGVTLH